MFGFKLFVDKNNNEKSINLITYKDIKNLIKREIHEGFYIDFKKEYNINNPNDKMKKKAKMDLIDDICSFANNEGGWLIFGIEEDGGGTFKDCPITKIEKLDYNQQISEIVKNGDCHPKPNFETKFVCCSNNKKVGYLLVHVLEGRNPPYISNGRIKTRTGSSTQSVDIKDRSSLDFLYKKRKDFNDDMKAFCQREVYYAPTIDNLIQTKYETPIINIYMKSNLNSELQNYEEIEQLAKSVCNKTIFTGYYYSSKSIIFYNAEVDHSKTATVIFELFFDYSAKIHIPLPRYGEEDEKNIIKALPQKYKAYDFKKYILFNGILLIDILADVFNIYNDILVKKSVNISNGETRVVFENTQNSIFIQNNVKYFDFIAQEGLRRCILSNSSLGGLIKPYLDANNKINLCAFINEQVIMQFGILATDIKKYNLLED